MRLQDYLTEVSGKASLGDVIKMAKKMDGNFDKKQDRGKPWNVFLFSFLRTSTGADKYRQFLKWLQAYKMSFEREGGPNANDRERLDWKVKVWF